MKKILISFLLFLLLPKQVFAQELPKVVFINQVRGSECCDVGSLKNLQTQIAQFEQNDLPVTFTIRYDVLNDQQYLNNLKNLSTNFTIGGFLEITPSWAKDAQVSYLGNEENWYEAQYAYLIGYSQNDRIKLIDTYMSKFRSEFGDYPQITTAWMIDTFSLNYLQEKYGVRVHQVTREQWGTDSYTLFGGPWHLPYQPSKNWLFMPGNSDLIIIRQTGSDPYFNYFDQTNAFTTQPNDYMIDGKDFSYFENLASQLLFEQIEPGFLLLGLENSIASNYQDEYLKQIDWVKANSDQAKVKVVSSVSKKDLEQFTSKDLTVVQGGDLINQTNNKAYFINANNYRARVIIDDKNVKISDLRIYSNQVKDPYYQFKAQKLGYFITPFIVDGAHTQIFENNQSISDKISLLLPEKQFQQGQIASKTDFFNSSLISFDYQSKLDVTLVDDNLVISYSAEGEDQKITFTSEEIKFEAAKIEAELFNQLNELKLVDVNSSDDQIIISLADSDLAEVVCQYHVCELKPILTNFNYQSLSKLEKKYLFPQLNDQKVDLEKSNIYINNPYRLIDGPTTRLVIIPRDHQGFLSRNINQLKIVYQNQVFDPGYQHGFWGFSFFDIKQDTWGKHDIYVVDQDQTKKLSFYIAPNCKNELFSCLLHPEYLWWNILSRGMQKLRDISS